MDDDEPRGFKGIPNLDWTIFVCTMIVVCMLIGVLYATG